MKALLLIWIGIGYGENQSLTKFDSLAECEAAKAAILAHDAAPNRGVHCIPYIFKE